MVYLWREWPVQQSLAMQPCNSETTSNVVVHTPEHVPAQAILFAVMIELQAQHKRQVDKLWVGCRQNGSEYIMYIVRNAVAVSIASPFLFV